MCLILKVVGGEEPLPAGGSCLLGSINLAEFVANPFTTNALFKIEEFEDAVEQGVIALNEILHEGLKLHPLEEQRESVNNWRQIGLGICGWHDCLIKLGMKYGGSKSIVLASLVSNKMINIAVKTSAELTDVYGPFPSYNKEALIKSKFYQNNIVDQIKKIVEEKGLANSQLLTIPPTGSTATMLGVSTGIEPIYDVSYSRKTESLHKKDVYYKVYTPVVKEYMEIKNITNERDLPDFINCAKTINYPDRILMQAAWQRNIDASISSTINLPESATVEDIEDIYMLAWQKGLKGVTVYRDNCKREGILSTTLGDEVKENELVWGTTLKMDDNLIGRKKKIMTGCGSLHVQGWFDPISGKLMELYLSKGSRGGCNSFMVSLSRMVSAGLRTGLDFNYVIDQLKSAPVCASYAVRTSVKRDTSKGNCCPVAIANALACMQGEVFNELFDNDEIEENNIPEIISISDKCPGCGANLTHQGGCLQCSICGWSHCE